MNKLLFFYNFLFITNSLNITIGELLFSQYILLGRNQYLLNITYHKFTK